MEPKKENEAKVETKIENKEQAKYSKGDKVKYYNRKGEEEKEGEIARIYESYNSKGKFIAVIKPIEGKNIERFVSKIRK